MLPFRQASRKMTYLSVDGGTYTVGLCLFEVDSLTNQMTVLRTHLINIHAHDPHYDYIEERHGNETMRMRRLRDEFNRFLMDIEEIPDLLIYESHFFNVRRPTAAIPLVRFMQVVEDICVDNGMTMTTVSPQQMKRTVGISKQLAKADKDIVKKKINGLIEDKYICCPVSLEEISEHEIDAIGIGFTQMVLERFINL